MVGNIIINKQSSIRIEKGKTIYFDPWDVSDFSRDADIIFITHDHPDHFSPSDVKGLLKDEGILVVPESMQAKAEKEAGIRPEQTVTVSPGNVYDIGGLRVETCLSFNKMKPFHMKSAGWCGYIVTLDNTRYYAMGDTDNVPELYSVSCDVLFVPIGGKFTMNLKDAIDYTAKILPKMAVPIHYGEVVGKYEDALEFKKSVEELGKSIHVEIIIKE